MGIAKESTDTQSALTLTNGDSAGISESKELEMAKIGIDTIGMYNRELVIELARGSKDFSGSLIEDFKHAQLYNYDSSGMPLSDSRVGVKYYCTSDGKTWDMKKRIVHVLDSKSPNNRAKMQFYRLIHTSAAPGLRDNSYQSCEEITGWKEAVEQRIADEKAAKEIQKEANRMGWMDVSTPVAPVTRAELLQALAKMQ